MFIGLVEIRELVDVNEFRSVAKYADADSSNIRCSKGHATLTPLLKKYFSIGNKNVWNGCIYFNFELESLSTIMYTVKQKIN